MYAYFTRKETPKADETRFNIAIADFEGSAVDNMMNIVRVSLLKAFPTANIVFFNRLVSAKQGTRVGHKQAHQLLKSSGFDVMVWGVVVQTNGKNIAALHITSLENKTNRDSPPLKMAEDLNLPSLIGEQLTDVLSLVIQTKINMLSAGGGQYEADKLRPFIQQVRDLLNRSESNQWNEAEYVKVQAILADSLITFGEQSGHYEAVQEAVDLLRKALEKTHSEVSPVAWGAMQRSLGIALQTLGVHERSSARLREAVDAYEAIPHNPLLKEEDREGVTILINLGNALASLGQTESNSELLGKAVVVYNKALLKSSREKSPHQWAKIQAMLGNTLLAKGQLEAAVTAYVSALNEFPCIKHPLHWAGTTYNLGLALMDLGKDSSKSAQLEASARAFESSLMVYRAVGAYYPSNDSKDDLQRVQSTSSRRSEEWIKPASDGLLRVSWSQRPMRSDTFGPACWGLSSQFPTPGFPPLLSNIAMFCGRAKGYNEFVFARLHHRGSCFVPKTFF
jgi:tetratricopeptide (TPR) repeat protein